LTPGRSSRNCSRPRRSILVYGPTAGFPTACWRSFPRRVDSTASGYLDAEAVWPLLLQRLVGLDGERPDLVVLLRWSIEAENVLRFRRLPEEVRLGIVDWLAAQVGPTATAVLRCASMLERPDLLPTGIISGIVHHPQSTEGWTGRSEDWNGTWVVRRQNPAWWNAGPPPRPRWGWCAYWTTRGSRARYFNRADEILREIQADEFAYLSDVLPRGFDQRLNRLGSLLGSAVRTDRGCRRILWKPRSHPPARSGSTRSSTS